MTHLDVDKDPMIRLVQNFVSFCEQGELKGDLCLPSWDLSSLGHLDVAAEQLDRL